MSETSPPLVSAPRLEQDVAEALLCAYVNVEPELLQDMHVSPSEVCALMLFADRLSMPRVDLGLDFMRAAFPAARDDGTIFNRLAHAFDSTVMKRGEVTQERRVRVRGHWPRVDAMAVPVTVRYTDAMPHGEIYNQNLVKGLAWGRHVSTATVVRLMHRLPDGSTAQLVLVTDLSMASPDSVPRLMPIDDLPSQFLATDWAIDASIGSR